MPGIGHLLLVYPWAVNIHREIFYFTCVPVGELDVIFQICALLSTIMVKPHQQPSSRRGNLITPFTSFVCSSHGKCEVQRCRFQSPAQGRSGGEEMMCISINCSTALCTYFTFILHWYPETSERPLSSSETNLKYFREVLLETGFPFA